MPPSSPPFADGESEPSGGIQTPLEEALGLTRKGTCVRHPNCPVLVNHAVMSCRICFSEEKSVGIQQNKSFAAVVNQLQSMGNAKDEEASASGDDAASHT